MKVVTLLSGQEARLSFPPNCPESSGGCTEGYSYAGQQLDLCTPAHGGGCLAMHRKEDRNVKKICSRDLQAKSLKLAYHQLKNARNMRNYSFLYCSELAC